MGDRVLRRLEMMSFAGLFSASGPSLFHSSERIEVTESNTRMRPKRRISRKMSRAVESFEWSSMLHVMWM